MSRDVDAFGLPLNDQYQRNLTMAKKKTNADKTDTEKLSFEQSLADLEKIVQELEDGELSMEDALASYEVGIGRLKRCYQLLDAAEKKVEQLISVDADGNAKTKSFTEPAS